MRSVIYSLICAVVLIGGSMKGNAVVTGVSPRIDPTLITDVRLPDEYDQGFKNGMPFGWFVVGRKADYSFGVAVDSKGVIYTASFNKQNVTAYYPDDNGRISLFGRTQTINLSAPALFAIAIDRNDDLIYSTCDGIIARYRIETHETEILAEGLTRPNQMAVDADNNVYIVTEIGQVMRYNDTDGTLETLAVGLGSLQSCAVAPDGTIYLLSYGQFSDVPTVGVGYNGGTLWKMEPDGTTDVVWQGDDRYVWRSRGLAVDDKGIVYITGEANAWDNGNSANVVRFDPVSREIEQVTAGMDYGTFLAYGADGRIYQCLARDDLIVAYSDRAALETVENNWGAQGVRSITYGGTYLPSSGGNELTFTVGSMTLTGALSSAGGRVCGWIRVPCESVPEINNRWDGTNNGHYPLPSVSALVTEGFVRTAVMPLRTHTRSRWPMPDIYTPASDFRDNPEAYLIYFEWRPEGEEAPLGDTFRSLSTETDHPVNASLTNPEPSESRAGSTVTAVVACVTLVVMAAAGILILNSRKKASNSSVQNK